MNFLFGNFLRSGSRSTPSQPSVPLGQRVYAIGDVHGRLDLLEQLLVTIEEDNAGRPPAKTTVIFLGDLIDRGPSSAQVVEKVRSLRLPGVRSICLCGNHEEVLIRVLSGDGDLLHDWLKFGGAECLRSYGLSPTRLKRMEPSEAVRRIREGIPKTHLKFLLNLADTVRVGDYLFVHAGIRPGVDLAGQSQTDLRWIRDPFLSHEEEHGFVVVHGHTIVPDVEVLPNRVGIDTGAYRSGVLTAIALEDSNRWFLEARSIEAAPKNLVGRARTEFA